MECFKCKVIDKDLYSKYILFNDKIKEYFFGTDNEINKEQPEDVYVYVKNFCKSCLQTAGQMEKERKVRKYA